MYGIFYYQPMLLESKLSASDISLIVFGVIVLVIAALYFLNRAAYRKMDEQQAIVESTKMTTTIYVIDKKRDKITNIKLPQAVQSQIPAYAKIMKMYFVKAKIGPQIMTLMCDKNVFNAIPLKRNIKAEIAGMYIVSFAGMKSADEMKKIRKEKKQKKKEEEKSNKKK